jgi:hypothetical protein
VSAVSFNANLFTGLGFNYKRNYEWRTAFQQALSGKRSTLSYMAYPLVHFEFEYNILHDDVTPSELQTLQGILNLLRGRYDTCLMTDPDFNTISVAQAPTLGVFGNSTGLTTTQYQLIALYAPSSGAYSGIGASEIIQNLNGTPVLYDNGTAISGSHYTIGPTGIVQFSTSPTSGHTLSWSGQFYYRVGFDEDTLEMTKFMNQWWTTKIKMTSMIL